jgi:hypothetical protein
MLRNSYAGICICKTAQSLFATAVTVMRAVPIFFLAIILTHGSVANGAELKVFTLERSRPYWIRSGLNSSAQAATN